MRLGNGDDRHEKVDVLLCWLCLSVVVSVEEGRWMVVSVEEIPGSGTGWWTKLWHHAQANTGHQFTSGLLLLRKAITSSLVEGTCSITGKIDVERH